MKKKSAYIILGADMDPEKHQAQLETDNKITYIFTVRSFEEAEEKVLWCKEQGFGVVELCGAFGEERAKKYRDMTEGKVGIAYVTRLPGQEEIFSNFFKK